MNRKLVAAVLASTLVAAAPAAASSTQESIVMDDAEIVYASPERLDATFAELKAIGVDRVRVSVFWHLVAPASDQKERPSFGSAGSASPAGYPAANWDRYDEIVRAAGRHGLGLLFSITGPAPLWATGSPERKDIEPTYEPKPDEFRDFVNAVATRYSGTYRDELPAPPPDCNLLGCQQQPAPEGEVLPRVDFWSIWNEPNHPGWLTPQWLPDPRGGTLPLLPAAARIYRDLMDAGWTALQASGHGSDTVLLAETAPRGLNDRGLTRAIRPLEFIRELYCLDRAYRPFQGEEAQVRGCPGTRDAFVSAHPGLFNATGWAHHPYALEQGPEDSDPQRDNVVLADLPRLTRTLDRIFSVHGQARRLPVWLTEYGYQTDPPDPTLGIPWSRHAAYLNHAEYLAFRNPRVMSMAQFLLVDDGPLRQFPPSDPRYWGTFQSGLRTSDGRNKSAYAAYQRPIHATRSRVRRGATVRIFGQLRSAANGSSLTAQLQFRTARSRRYRKVRTVRTSNPRGFMLARVRPRQSGWYRLVWRDGSSGRQMKTRRVRVTVR